MCVLCGDRGALLPEPVPGPAVRDAVPGVPHVQPGRPAGGLRLALPGLAGLLHLRGGGAQLVQAVGGHLPGTTLLLLQPWGPRVIYFSLTFVVLVCLFVCFLLLFFALSSCC